MDIKSLKPASTFAKQFGIKIIVYGGPGTKKTPLTNTCPRPVLLACEPGLRSMSNSNVPTWLGYDAKTIDEFFKWFFNSTETKNFDTICIDSISQMAELYLDAALKGTSNSGKKVHGLAAYGEMSANTQEKLNGLYYTREKHTYLIAKETMTSDENGFRIKRPYFPGQELPVKIPHLYDEIIHIGIHNIPSIGQIHSLQCQPTIDITARDRTGLLDQYEEAHFGKLIQKCMS